MYTPLPYLFPKKEIYLFHSQPQVLLTITISPRLDYNLIFFLFDELQEKGKALTAMRQAQL